MAITAEKRILVVEDEVLIAMQLAMFIEQMGSVVLGPASSCEEALTLLQGNRPHAAIIDVLLGEETCERVVEQLGKMGVPWAVATGYQAHSLDPIFRNVPIAGKPHSFESIERLLNEMLAPDPAFQA